MILFVPMILTKPLKYTDIPDLQPIKAKTDAIDNLLSNAFSQQEISTLSLDDLFQNKLDKLKQIIDITIGITSVKIESRLHLTQLFSNQFKYIASFKSNKETQVLYRFLQGSVNYFQANIMTNAYCYQEKDKQLDYINYALNIFHSHLFFLLDKLVKNREAVKKA